MIPRGEFVKTVMTTRQHRILLCALRKFEGTDDEANSAILCDEHRADLVNSNPEVIEQEADEVGEALWDLFDGHAVSKNDWVTDAPAEEGA